MYYNIEQIKNFSFLNQQFRKINKSEILNIEQTIIPFLKNEVLNLSQEQDLTHQKINYLFYLSNCLNYIQELYNINSVNGFEKNKKLLQEKEDLILVLQYELFYENNGLRLNLNRAQEFVKNVDKKFAINLFQKTLLKPQDKQYFKLKSQISDISSILMANLTNYTDDIRNWIRIEEKQLKYFPQISQKLINQGIFNAAKLQESNVLLYEPTDYYINSLLIYCESKKIRRTLYTKYMQANKKGKYNNQILLKTIIKKKQNLALISGESDYFDYVSKNYLLNKENLINFFNLSIEKIEPLYIEKLKQNSGIKNIKPWDNLYLENKLYMKNRALISKHSFDSKKALHILLNILSKEFNLLIKEEKCSFSSLILYKFTDKSSKKEGLFYFDLYKRKNKLSNVNFCKNMQEHSVYKNIDTINQNYIITNFNKIISFDELLILGHEIGHGLKNFFSQHKYSVISQNNLSDDLIELPSQYIEKLIIHKYLNHFSLINKDDESELKKALSSESKLVNFYKNVVISRDKMNLFINFKKTSKKQLEDFFSDVTKNNHNMYNDYFMLGNSDYLDYGATPYVYALNDLMAYSLIKKTLDNKQSSLNIFKNIINNANLYKNHQKINNAAKFDLSILDDYLN